MSEAVTRAALLARRPTAFVDLEAGKLLVRALTTGEVWAWQDAHADEARRRAGEPAALLVLYGALNGDHSQMFAPDDLPAVLAMPFVTVEAIASAVLKVSGLDPEAQKARAGN